jgi:uncharacterized protein YodC (DUF2158 family)
MSKKAQFAVGDVVRLKSGSAGLTVTAVNEDLDGTGTFEVDVIMTWFDYAEDKFASDSLPQECLRLAVDDE